MNVITIQTGDFLVNTYLIHQETSKDCIIIDPGGSFNKIVRIAEEYGLLPNAVLLTHGHFDHFGALKQVVDKYSAKVYIHAYDADMLIKAEKNLSAFFGKEVVCDSADFLLRDNQELEICGIKTKVLHTPGHSPGGVTFLMDGVAFTGDTLFNMSIGRTDFLGCDMALMRKSLDRLKKEIPKDYKIFSGHGNESTFEYELENNPYL